MFNYESAIKNAQIKASEKGMNVYVRSHNGRYWIDIAKPHVRPKGYGASYYKVTPSGNVIHKFNG